MSSDLDAAYSDWPQALPPNYDPGEMARAKDRLWELLQEVTLVHLGHVNSAGDPVSQPLRFGAQQGTDRPLIYVDADAAGLRALLEPYRTLRLSASIFRAVGFENRRNLRSAQIQAVGRLDRLSQDLGPLSAGATVVRMTPIHVAWHDADLRPPRGSITFEP